MNEKIIAVVSGGLDSTTMLYDSLYRGYSPDVVSFNYGQRHAKELEYAAAIASRFSLRHDVVDLSSLTKLLSESGSSLVSGTEVPEGHYAEENMKQTVVPNRNMIMISIAGGIAVARKATSIVLAVHAGDHFIYPDCRPEFIQAAANALVAGNEGFSSWFHSPALQGEESAISVPYLMHSKADIAYRAMELGLPLEDTWSCYKGGVVHCGKCGTCVERLEAIDEAQQRWKSLDPDSTIPADETVYEDKEYWKTVVANRK